MYRYLLVIIMILSSLTLANAAMPDTSMMGGTCNPTALGVGGALDTDPDTGKAEIGDLYYPGSAITNSAVTDMMGQKNVMVVMSSTDPLDKIAAYYAPKFNEKNITYTHGPGFHNWMKPMTSADKSMARVTSVALAQDANTKDVTITVSIGQGQDMGSGMK
jgi:hypothetical protein